MSGKEECKLFKTFLVKGDHSWKVIEQFSVVLVYSNFVVYFRLGKIMNLLILHYF